MTFYGDFADLENSSDRYTASSPLLGGGVVEPRAIHPNPFRPSFNTPSTAAQAQVNEPSATAFWSVPPPSSIPPHTDRESRQHGRHGRRQGVPALSGAYPYTYPVLTMRDTGSGRLGGNPALTPGFSSGTDRNLVLKDKSSHETHETARKNIAGKPRPRKNTNDTKREYSRRDAEAQRSFRTELQESDLRNLLS